MRTLCTGLHQRFKARLEEAQVFWFENHLQTFGALARIENGFETLSDHIHMSLGVHPPGDCQAGELQGGIAVVASLGVTPGADNPALHRTHSGIQVQRRRQHLGGELVLGDMWVEAFCIQEDGMPANRLYDGDIPIHQ